ncbi:hypothetical protein [Robbsia andropogonis]|uniref:hypothetical protein n=1 Tax=Robbsia andropogonis TaxID=28092 RepID=UPI002A6B8750|nr:hypothetical protein [Robbsia andropogonis]
MRYYDITIQDGTDGRTYNWSSQTNGAVNPAALQVEFDLLVNPYGSSSEMSMVTIHGISMDELRASQTFAGMNLTLKGGMQKGLPLAKPSQAGVLLKGYIIQSFGNWEGTELSITFVVSPTGYTFDSPGNFVMDWPAGTTLGTALKNMFQVALPSMTVTDNTSAKVVLSHHEQHYASTLDGIADVVYEMTKGNFVGSSYPGVKIAIQGGEIQLYDQTTQETYTQIEYTDLVGQPAWFDTSHMMMKLVMRADIKVGSYIKMPQGMQSSAGQVVTTASSQPGQVKYSLAFTGTFLVDSVRHIGDFRGANGASWITVVTCRPTVND